MFSFVLSPAAAPAPILTADLAQTPASAPPELGSRAVTAMVPGKSLREDASLPLRAPTLPAPLKGLGIPPLNTRQVGDFDKLDAAEPPVGLSLSDGLGLLDSQSAAAVDLRR